MPRGDRTGPMGIGPMTGWGAGYCSGHTVPGKGGVGFGRGRGCGLGMGWRHGWAFREFPFVSQPVNYSQLDEISSLKKRARYLGDVLQFINSRISELEAEK